MEFYGLLGEKLSHSLSPQIHKKVFELEGIDGGYKLFPISKEDIKGVGEWIKIFGIKGMNVTIPYKEEIMNQLDFISEEAMKIGAVNTINLIDGKLHGYNTDYYGFGKMLEMNGVDVKNKVAVILGTGGASKAVIEYLLDSGAKELYLVSRDKSSKNVVNDKVKLVDYIDLKDIDGDLIINTTPVGMYPKVGESPVDEEIINKFSVLVDLIYNPRKTEFLRLGKKLGKRTCDGLYMLVGQAVKSQEIWQNTRINDEIINIIYEELNSQFN